MSASSAEGAETAEEIREAKRLRLRENIRMIASLPTMHSTNDMLGAMAGQAYEGEYLCSALPEENFEQRLMDWEKDYYGAKSGKVLDKDKVHEATELEIENMQRLEVYETIDLAEAKRAKMEIVYTKWLDGEKPTAADPAAVRSRLLATQINNYTREDVGHTADQDRADGAQHGSISKGPSRTAHVPHWSTRHPGCLLPCEGLR